jgi:hypothetical protein
LSKLANDAIHAGRILGLITSRTHSDFRNVAQAISTGTAGIGLGDYGYGCQMPTLMFRIACSYPMLPTA